MKKLKKLTAAILTATMLITAMPISVFATTVSVGSDASNTVVGEDKDQNTQTEYAEISENGAQTNVYLTVADSDLIASLPTTVILSGTPNDNGEYKGDYSVEVQGDMSGDKTITIEPETENNINLHQKGKNDMQASISQEQTEFTTDDFANKTQTTGTVTAVGLTAGSWNSEFNFNIKVNKINIYYSSLALAAQDINQGTVGTKDTVSDLPTIENAVCGVFKDLNGSYRIELFKDIDNQTSLTFTENAKLNLRQHYITFSAGSYITYYKDFDIYNGTLNSTDTQYVIFGEKENLNSSFNINDITINQSISENITATAFGFDVSSVNVNSNNLTINTTGNGNPSYNYVGIVTRNATEQSNQIIKNYTFNCDIQNCGRIGGAQVSGNTTIEKPTITINSTKALVRGLHTAVSSLTTTINDATISVRSNQNSCYGIGSNSKTTYINNCVVNATVTNEVLSSTNTIQNSARGISAFVDASNITINNTTVIADSEKNAYGGAGIVCQNKGNTSINNCNVYGKMWGIQTSPYGTTEIRGGEYTATNHIAYMCGNTNAYNATFKVANREKYNNAYLDSKFGLYCGTSRKDADDYIVNFYNCTINSPIDEDKTNCAEYGITAKANGYKPAKEINLYDTTVYQGGNACINYNYVSPNHKATTKFNLYGTTKLMKNSTDEWSKEEITSEMDWFFNPTEITYREDNLQAHVVSKKRFVEVYYSYKNGDELPTTSFDPDAGVYDYR